MHSKKWTLGTDIRRFFCIRRRVMHWRKKNADTMIGLHVPTEQEIDCAFLGLFRKSARCDKKIPSNALFPNDPALDLASGTNVPFWEYDEIIGFAEMIEDLIHQHEKSVPTEIRLRLMGYCHIMEADFPLAVIWNLLRITAGQQPSWNFASENKKQNIEVCEYPRQKIDAIVSLAAQLKEPIGKCLQRLWVPALRNAFSHSQYALMEPVKHDDYIMLTAGLSPISRTERSLKKMREAKGNPSFDDIRSLYQGALTLLKTFIARYNEAGEYYSLYNRGFGISVAYFRKL